MSRLSTTANTALMSQARESLRGKWGLAVGTTVLLALLTGVVQAIPKIGPFISTIIAGPLAIGFATFILSLTRNEPAQSAQLFDGFNRFGVGLGAYLLQLLFVILWSLLLIVPGIIAGISYSMTYYLIADDKNIGPLEAIAKSKAIMYGNKWKFACLSARFIGWALLAILSLGIGFLWLLPYMAASTAHFYAEMTNDTPLTPPAAAGLANGENAGAVATL
jgi:uncharacterized membrane protein